MKAKPRSAALLPITDGNRLLSLSVLRASLMRAAGKHRLWLNSPSVMLALSITLFWPSTWVGSELPVRGRGEALAQEGTCTLRATTDGVKVTATATVRIDGNAPPDTDVMFEVVDGPNQGVKGTAKTNNAGRAMFMYSTNGQKGTDKIKASGTYAGEVPFSCMTTVEIPGSEGVQDGPPTFTTPIENPTKPACGCSGEPTYNQGISEVTPGCNKCETIGDYPGISEDTGGQTVFLHNGEFFTHAVDLEIPGRGFNWKFERKYRSGIIFNGPLGHNWEFNYNRRLVVEASGDVLRMDGNARADRYERMGRGFRAPAGYYTRLVKNRDGTFVERDRRGTQVFYSGPDARGIARMTEIRDRNGNRMQFEYNDQGQLIRVIDTLGRPIDYFYNDDGRLIEVRDFFNRSIRFEYNMDGDLVVVTSPIVTGTPNGNDFPLGKTTRYTYSSGFTDARLNHNLLTITAPNEVAVEGPPRVEVEYDVNPSSPAFDRVVRQTIGGVNQTGVPAGGTISYEYESLGGTSVRDLNTPVAETRVTDRNGNVTEYQFNQIGNIVRIREFTNRNIRQTDPEFFETRYEYNKDGEMTRMIYPEGNSVEYVYDDQNGDRFQQGNLLSEIRRPDPERGGDQDAITTTYTYEPIYNQVRTITEVRGNDPNYAPQNGGANSPERYTTVYTFDYQEGQDFRGLAAVLGVSQRTVRNLLKAANIPTGLGDINGDGRTDQIAGNPVKVVYPTVNLLANSNMARIEGGTRQPIEEIYVYNQFGQVTKDIDPEGNVTLYDYHPENDPDGDGLDLTPGVGSGPFGYLKEEIRDAEPNAIRNSRTDPEPTRIQMQYFYDRVGNVIRHIDGRGIATDYVVNQLNQVVQVVRAAAHDLFPTDPPEPLALVDFRYLERIFYDFNDNVIRRQIEDRGNTSQVGGDNAGSGTAFVDYVYGYDILDKEIEMSEEVGDSEDLVTRYRYDPNENQVLVIQPEGNASSAVFDERDLLFQGTRGTVAPPPLALLAPDDPRGYDVRGGVPSTMTYHYDLNRNLIESVDAADTDGSAANNSKRVGFGDRTRYIYDGFDRLTSVVDSVGNQTVTQYDPAGNIVRELYFGPVGGPSPTSAGPDVLPMPVSSDDVVQPAHLVNHNLLAATETLYDELNRPFQADRVLFVNTISTVRPPDVADGAADIGKGDLTPNDNQPIPGINGINILGRVSTRTEYDRNSRPAFSVEDDGDTYPISYDGVDRAIKVTDPEGDVLDGAYDDNDNFIEIRQTDVSQVQGVADEVFLTTYFYDSLNRPQREVDNIAQTIDYRYDSRDNLVAIADAQGPMTGESISRRAFPEGAHTVNATNDFGNVTLYFYDGINRQVRGDVVLTGSGKGDGVHIGADIFGVKTATPTPDPSQGGGDGLITVRYEWDKNSLQASLTDDNGNQTRYTYDNLNRVLTETKGICVPPALADRCDPPTTNANEYDPDDNVFRFTDENGSVISYQFDAIDRGIASQIRRAPGVIGTTAESYEYDGLSRLTRATDNNEPEHSSDDSLITFAYDSLSRLIEETQKIGDLPAKAISSAWRTDELRSGLGYPNGRVVDHTYDLLDRLKGINDRNVARPIVNYDYIGPWRVARRSYMNGTRMTYLDGGGTRDVGYDGLRRPVQLRHLRDDNSLIVGFTHTYDRMNNKLTEEKVHAPRDSELYRYDSVHRLTRFERGTLNRTKDGITMPSVNLPLHSHWTLDGVGNWQGVDAEIRKHSSFNEIVERTGSATTSILSDNNGNETDDGAFLFEWDYMNRLRRVTRKADGAMIAAYSYDALDRRIRKVVTNSGDLNGTTDFYYDGVEVVEERDQADGVVQQYVYGYSIDEPVVLDRNLDEDGVATGPEDQRLFYHQNTLGSIFALTDESGAIVEDYQYDAYGAQTVFGPGPGGTVNFSGNAMVAVGGSSLLANPYMFAGRRLDPETGLYYYRMRYLSPEQGRLLSRNFGYRDGANLYEYAYSGPTFFVDPFGLDAWVKQGSSINYGDNRPSGSVIKTSSGSEWRKEGDTWYLYHKRPVPKPKPTPKPAPKPKPKAPPVAKPVQRPGKRVPKPAPRTPKSSPKPAPRTPKVAPKRRRCPPSKPKPGTKVLTDPGPKVPKGLAAAIFKHSNKNRRAINALLKAYFVTGGMTAKGFVSALSARIGPSAAKGVLGVIMQFVSPEGAEALRGAIKTITYIHKANEITQDPEILGGKLYPGGERLKKNASSVWDAVKKAPVIGWLGRKLGLWD